MILSDLEGNLCERDEASRAGRTERLAELIALGEPADGRMLFGDCLTALYEAQWSYVNGLDLCAILAAQACVEKLLSGLIEFADLGPTEGSYARLLKYATTQRLLSTYEYELFDRLRRARNPHAHHRAFNHREGSIRRAMATGADPDVLLHRDAQAAVRGLIGLVNRHPFALGPPIALFAEDDLVPSLHPDQLSFATDAVGNERED